jgi:hypothetical protein
MPRLSLTKKQVSVARDALQHLSAYTDDEMRDHLDWNDDEIQAWDEVLGKLTHLDLADGSS